MALSASTVWEVRTAGSDTNGGGFVTGAAGADFSQQNSANATNQGTTTLSAAITSTSATSCTVTAASALYGAAQALLANPLVGDWIQIDSEVMKVTAVSTNTLTITRGQLGTTAATHLINATVTNISNVSTTDWVTASSTTITSATAFFSANLVGNIVYVAGGTGSITAGWYQVTAAGTSVALTTITVDRSTGLSVGTGATGNIGGALGSPGQAGANAVANNGCYIESGTTYSITSATANISGGCVSWPASTGGNEGYIIGYQTTRGDNGTKPLLQATSISTFTIIAVSTKTRVQNISVDGASSISSKGIASVSNFQNIAYLCKSANCTAGGIVTQIANSCEATGCSTTVAIGSPYALMCWSHDNTIGGFAASATFSAANYYFFCLSTNNSGASSDGFNSGGNPAIMINCSAWSNGRNGFTIQPGNAGNYIAQLSNCLATANSGYGFGSLASGGAGAYLINCAGYSNTSGNVQSTDISVNTGFQTLTGDPFVATGSNNFALNNNSGAGAQCRAAGTPGVLPGGLTTGYLDIGAAQHQDSPAQLFIIND